MIQPRKFEAFDLELLCKYIAGGEELGRKYYLYMLDDILGNEMSVYAEGMAYGLINVDSIYNALSNRLEQYKDDVEPFEKDILNFLETFNHGDETLVYVKGW